MVLWKGIGRSLRLGGSERDDLLWSAVLACQECRAEHQREEQRSSEEARVLLQRCCTVLYCTLLRLAVRNCMV